MNIFDIIDRKNKEKYEQEQQKKQQEQSKPVFRGEHKRMQTSVQPKELNIEQLVKNLLEIQDQEMNKRALAFYHRKRRDSNLYLWEIAKISIMKKFLTKNNLSEEEFRQVLENQKLLAYKKLVKEYPYNTFVEDLVDHGTQYIVYKIDLERKLNKSLNNTKEIKDDGVMHLER